MFSNSIYSILLTKCPQNTRNLHYLKRYIRFMIACRKSNTTLPDNVYTEEHHIIPKSKSFWPEYRNLKKHPWNGIRLTARQHYIAHWMLANSLGKGMWFAFNMMCNLSNKYQNRDVKVNSTAYKTLKENFSSEMSKASTKCTKTPEAIENHRKSRKGYRHSDGTRKKLKEANNLKKHGYTVTVRMYHGIYKIEVPKYCDKLYQYLAEGWVLRMPREYRSHISALYGRNNRPNTRLVKVYFGRYYCLVINDSEDYHNGIQMGGSPKMTPEYKVRLSEEKSRMRKGDSRPRKDTRKRVRRYSPDGSYTYFADGDSIPKGFTKNSPSIKKSGWFIDAELRELKHTTLYEAEVNGWVKLYAPNGDRKKFLTSDGKTGCITLSEWPYDWFPRNITWV